MQIAKLRVMGDESMMMMVDFEEVVLNGVPRGW